MFQIVAIFYLLFIDPRVPAPRALPVTSGGVENVK